MRRESLPLSHQVSGRGVLGIQLNGSLEGTRDRELIPLHMHSMFHTCAGTFHAIHTQHVSMGT